MKTWIIVGIFVAILAGWHEAVAQNGAAETVGKSRLVLVIEPAKTTYSKGEPIEFSFKLSNRSGSKVLVAKTFQLAYYVSLNISNAEGERAQWCGRIVSQIDSPHSFTTLSPGESVSKKLVISCVNKDDRTRAWGYSVDAPGKYVVRATYRLPQPKVFFQKRFPNVPAERGPVSAGPVTIELR